ncbi:hypothetical protein DMH04_27280 [Kibdelosporangium aridum]|uniref:Uncharacterized protein n=1 Tax=Kibdelosporangium aridum TaxID=2030 RepID=A0A428Z4R6_KIBAR|nr:hypothetical protein [Kibdelosporangium aridum]RSM81585.1 hypothetical protein DMH04_27280 [Kibdelosporangium aridum]
MIEILDHLDVLTQPDVAPESLSLAGVPYGSRAADSIDRTRVTQVSWAPIIGAMRGGSDGWEYFDADDRPLSLDEVIDSALADRGSLLYTPAKISFKVEATRVVTMALYGERLDHFASLRTYDEFLATFGKPDHMDESWDTGELMSYSNYYWRSRKLATWDCWDNRVALVSLGEWTPDNKV